MTEKARELLMPPFTDTWVFGKSMPPKRSMSCCRSALKRMLLAKSKLSPTPVFSSSSTRSKFQLRP
ncbi:MAG: hypothetical protein OXG35_18130 [Acidobacteria bacterium]|nr:hypothetical protein [Acidobacteriota bacterium]